MSLEKFFVFSRSISPEMECIENKTKNTTNY